MYYQNGVHTDEPSGARWGMPFRRRRLVGGASGPLLLAADGAEAEGVEEGAGADLARMGGGGLRARTRGGRRRALGLRPLVEEDHTSAVDDVGLHATDVQRLLHLRDPHHVVVGGPSYLYTDAQRPATRRG
ncbi:unnamed protein product [Spirodela intermedia]|uniref:Uncharacterized protein n=1 Tax=Spirodela intermedia TaxID=51605 RepID=A0A7I8K1T4_SPIIN|nr:unnamed protein product [Spirodela intermedia]